MKARGFARNLPLSNYRLLFMLGKTKLACLIFAALSINNELDRKATFNRLPLLA
tara:strand:- start:358 stop:519 length:162 start_codon:yes stop_codon:yes gene_type:complete